MTRKLKFTFRACYLRACSSYELHPESQVPEMSLKWGSPPPTQQLQVRQLQWRTLGATGYEIAIVAQKPTSIRPWNPCGVGGRLWWNARRTTDFQEKCYFTQAFKRNERPSLARYWQDLRRSELEGTLAHYFWSPCWPSGEVRVKKDSYPLQSVKRSLPLRRCKHAKSNLICLGYTFDWQSPAFWSWKRWMAAQPLQ